jgi:DmsE family decaheme c-type cytochrome
MKKTFKVACLMGIAWASLPVMAQAEEIDWAALNPGFAKAAYVTDKETCIGCHADSIDAYHKTVHGLTFQHGAKGALQARDCEACHGPRSEHVNAPDDSLKLSTEQYSAVCLQCHQDGGRMHWQNSQHKTGEVGCVSCHTLMKKESDKGLLSRADEPSVCYSCHATVRGQMNKTSHHPVKEGKMACSSCHNPHGSVGKSMLKEATVNETCFTCHQEKRGPFVWEHPVVRENCASCHDAHGSNNADMLNSKGSFLCMQCHSYGGHINLPRYNRTSNPYGQGCVNCHVTQHGSNHPSGAKFTR